MQVLEKILQQVEAEFDKIIGTHLKIMVSLGDEVYRYGYGKSIEAYEQSKLLVGEIIRSQMEDVPDINDGKIEPVSNPDKLEDGWIPVEEYGLPEMSGMVWVSLKNAYAGYSRKAYWTGKHFEYPGNRKKILDKPVAWQPLPAPYQPKEEKR